MANRPQGFGMTAEVSAKVSCHNLNINILSGVWGI